MDCLYFMFKRLICLEEDISQYYKPTVIRCGDLYNGLHYGYTDPFKDGAELRRVEIPCPPDCSFRGGALV